jgi:hypothetical protein
MNSCPFSNPTCGLSTPCAKCRSASSNASHAPVRLDSLARRRGAYRRSRYQTKIGGYWEQAA